MNSRPIMLAIITVALVVAGRDGRGAQEGTNRILRGESRIQQDGAPSHYILINPRNFTETKSYPLFIFLHGRGTSPKFTLDRDHDLWTQQDYYILLPQAPDNLGDGFSWYTLDDANQYVADLERDERIIKQMIADVTAANRIDSSKITLSGFSAGGRLCFYIGFRNPRLFTEIIPVAGYYIPELLDSRINDLGGLKLSIFHGTLDDVNSFDEMKKSYYMLLHKGVTVTMTTYALGHTYTPELLKIILGKVK